MGAIDIRIPYYTCAVSISGEKNQKDEMKKIFLNAKITAKQLGTEILKEEEFEDGFFLEVKFTEEKIMDLWKNGLRIK